MILIQNIMAKTIILTDTSNNNEQLYPMTLLDNVIASNGQSIAAYISSLLNYGSVTYTVNAISSAGGTLSLAGTTPLHVVTLTGNVSALTLSANPAEGHSCHVILTAASAQTVAIAHDATNRVCPGAEDISLDIPAGGYVELDFLTANSKVYVRGV